MTTVAFRVMFQNRCCYRKALKIAGTVYMVASQKNGTLYIGVTSDLARRIYEHKSGLIPGFTSRYGVHRLVWMEEYFDIGDAIAREKEIKKWRRAWKVTLIEAQNPDWNELFVGGNW